jgi:hypothetical protein
LEGRAKVYLGIISAFLAAMILKASDAEATSALNNGTAKLLSWGSFFMASGIIYLLGIVLFAIWRAQWHN